MITKTDQSLSNIFDVTPTTNEVVKYESATDVTAVTNKTSQDTDFDIARTTIHNLLLKGQQSLDNAIIIANGTEEADSFNAVTNLIAKMTEASVKLMGLHEIKSKITKPTILTPDTPHESGTMNINGPVFVGSTSELSAFITKQQKLNKQE